VSFDPSALGELYPWQPGRLAVTGGAELSFLDEGPRGGDTLLMVHGNPTWSFYYRGLVEALSDRFRCVVPDHVGMGASDKPQDYPYTLGTHVANLQALTDHLGLRERVTLVVHDWGGAIGVGWAARNLQAVDRLVVLNTAAFRSPRIPFSINLCRIPGFGALAVRGLNAFARAAVVRAARTRLPAPVARGYTAPYGSWADRIATLRFVEDIPMHPGVPSWAVMDEVEAALPALRDRPMLICWGGADFCFDDTFLAGWRERFPAAEVHRFAEAGHYVLEDAGPQVLERVEAFLARTAAGAAPEAPQQATRSGA